MLKGKETLLDTTVWRVWVNIYNFTHSVNIDLVQD